MYWTTHLYHTVTTSRSEVSVSVFTLFFFWCSSASFSPLCVGAGSQHALSCRLCGLSYSLSVPSAPFTPRRQITTAAAVGAGGQGGIQHTDLRQPPLISSK